MWHIGKRSEAQTASQIIQEIAQQTGAGFKHPFFIPNSAFRIPHFIQSPLGRKAEKRYNI